ncbi:membrane-associated zinc metalloprotease [Desulfarculus baarsii DSM 2075]|uniref:Zinc metalloprotease n=1 Tax=Desulfarculus baarsii (strain ATCC 33931 / DSM 2075 / LMG 7858 / VKM B-1802 / 2st14) TaxID=644282 RepID=E1QEY3_DESB2|nr:RIP metalloprotease RseP [Desulfarculus baarsii]ADK84119.1 membrane-associated zinc metalloprotease [Desulfarculus baarsii DSM 2075]
MLITIASAVLVLGVLVFVHELGHFLVAKRLGVGVSVFSLGFGPRLAGFKRGETDYRLSAIPLGGFVRMIGESPGEPVAPEDLPRSFSHKGVWRRMAIVAAGPLSNVLFAFLLYYAVTLFWGQPMLTAQVGSLVDGMPAQAAGLRPGDVISAVDGRAIASWDDLREAIRASQGRRLMLTAQRDGQALELAMSPKRVDTKDIFGDVITVYQVGVAPSGQVLTQSFGPLEAVGRALGQTIEASQLILVSVGKIATRQVPMESVGGPIFIAQVAGEAARHGLNALLGLAALISVNLAILNLLPIPALDGGHLLVFLFEAVTRRPVSTRVRERIQQAGVFCLLLLTVLVLYNDIARIFGQTGP